MHISGFPGLQKVLILFVDFLGWVGAVAGALVALPQVVRILRTSATTGVSPLTWQLLVGVNLAWMAYGVITHHPNIVVSNTLYALCTSTILILLWRHRGTRLWQLLFPGFCSERSSWRWIWSSALLPSRDRVHTGRPIPASPVAFACGVAEHPRGVLVVACLLRHESVHLAHLGIACR
jgi:uncharacterized protein with PQ loop repeat